MPKRNIWLSHCRILPAAFRVPRASTFRASSTTSGRVISPTGRLPMPGMMSLSRYKRALYAVASAQRGAL